MPKRIFFIIGVLVGLLFGEVLRRKRMERLAQFEAYEVRSKALHKEWEVDWKAHLSGLPPEEKLEWALFEAHMEADNWEGSWLDEAEE